MRKKIERRAVLLTVLLLATFLGVTTEAGATQASTAIYNSENSGSAMGITTNTRFPYGYITATGSLYWPPGGLLNRQNPSSADDAIGYYIGPGWCGIVYVQIHPELWFVSWNRIGTVGPGVVLTKGTPHDTLIGIENHPANRGGPHGCG